MGKILCATRGGEAAVKNQQAAIARAKENNDSILFFYVVDVEFLAHANYVLRSDVVIGEMDNMADFLMTMAVERAEQAGVEASYIVCHGEFTQQLKETILKENVSLVVLGKPEEQSAFVLTGLLALAGSLKEKTGVEVWIPGLE